MSTKVFNLPDLGEGLTESEITTWRVAEGDTVEVNQVLADVETAKAVVELSSPYAGVIKTLHASEGETVDVGAPIITFDLGGDDDASDDDADSGSGDGRVPTLVGYGAAADKGRPARRARRGSTGPNAEDSVSSTPTAEMAAPHKNQPQAEADSKQASVPSQAQSGSGQSGSAGSSQGSGQGEATASGASASGGERPRSTPPVRLYAKQNGIDLSTLTGSGAGGVITRSDVAAAIEAGGAGAAPQASAQDSGAEQGGSVGVRTLGGRPRTVAVPVKGVRKATAQAMVTSAFTAPHVTEFLQVDVTETMELLAELKASREFRDVKLTPMTLAAKACLVAMERTPDVNAKWNEASGEIVQQNFVNLGFAAATPRGLMVPNVKDAQAMSLTELADAIRDLTNQAREGKLGPADLSGGTFTLTNVGVFGVDAGTPIINPGEGAIIAIGQVRRIPWEYQGEIALRQIMTLSLSFDHRFVDGEQGSRFLADVGAILRRPGLTLTMI
ncbi:MAG: dihydrolipoamide acetyltransferase family protein [Micrococcus sp.]|nr:dihydrolipoamide acetyltransferase family protein [Micrococcus sp.]